MAEDFDALFAADMRLLGDLEHAEQRERGSDVFTAPRPETDKNDLQRLHGVENLQQALLLRFLTQVGELTHLGHASYGSRLHELVGEPNTVTSRNRAKLYALQALTAEPRVAAVESLDVITDPGNRNTILIKARLRTIDSPVPLTLLFPVDLAGALAAGGAA
jgi:phage gp46-like protein